MKPEREKVTNKTKVESVQLGCLLKLSIFVVQKAAAPKNGVEFRQGSIEQEQQQ